MARPDAAAAAASPAAVKAYSAEAGTAWVRFAVIAFNIPVYWLLLAPQGVPWLAAAVSVAAGLYAVIIVALRPYERFPAMTTAAWTAVTDASLIVLWIHATGDYASPYYLLWYLSLFAITFRYDARATLLAAALYAALYTAQLAAAGTLLPHAADVLVRDTYILLVGALGAILARETLRAFTERFELGRQVQETERFRALAEANPEAVAIIDHGRLAEVNEAYCRLVGQPRERLIGTPAASSTPDPEASRLIRAHLEAGRGVQETWIPGPDGVRRLIRASLSPIAYQGRPATFVALRDVTEEHAAEEARRHALESEMEVRRLKEVDRFKTEFINAAAHELNTPLTPLKIQLHILKRKLPADSSLERRTVDLLDRNLERLTRLVDEMLDVARLNSGRLRLRPVPADLAALVREAGATFEASAAERGIALAVEAPATLPGTFDPQRATQILYNLLSNALKFTPDGGRVTVRAKGGGGWLEVEVMDTGAGLTAQQAERLFQPFTRLHRDQVDAPGTGLGLYISQGIVQGHGGTLAAASAGPGQGATFTLRLPERARPEPPAAPPDAGQA